VIRPQPPPATNAEANFLGAVFDRDAVPPVSPYADTVGVEPLSKAYDLSRPTDLCCYWFERARGRIANPVLVTRETQKPSGIPGAFRIDGLGGVEPVTVTRSRHPPAASAGVTFRVTGSRIWEHRDSHRVVRRL